MKKTLFVIVILAFCSTFVPAKEASKPADFSGNWVLNFGETKNPPAGLQRYSMVINQDAQQLKVKTTLEGNLQAPSPAPNSSGYPGGGGYPGSRRGGMGGMGGMGMPGIGMGMPRGGGGGRSSRIDRPSQGNVAAYKLYPQSVVYKLDGSESTAQLGDPEKSDATSKLQQEKGGQVLKVSLLRNGDSGSGKIQIKEQWKLAEDGKSLKVDRTIKSPEGSATVHLVFLKAEDESSSGAPPAPQ
jgi:hypothetical protein